MLELRYLGLVQDRILSNFGLRGGFSLARVWFPRICRFVFAIFCLIVSETCRLGV